MVSGVLDGGGVKNEPEVEGHFITVCIVCINWFRLVIHLKLFL